MRNYEKFISLNYYNVKSIESSLNRKIHFICVRRYTRLSCNCWLRFLESFWNVFPRACPEHYPGFCLRIYRVHRRWVRVYCAYVCSHTRTRPNPPTCICKPYRAPRMRWLCNRNRGATGDAGGLIYPSTISILHFENHTFRRRCVQSGNACTRPLTMWAPLSLSFSIDLFHIYSRVSLPQS